MSDPTEPEPVESAPPVASTPPVERAAARKAKADAAKALQATFTKAPQPELPLEQRREKAGLNRNRIGIWIVVSGFALYLIITGIVGILTKAR